MILFHILYFACYISTKSNDNHCIKVSRIWKFKKDMRVTNWCQTWFSLGEDSWVILINFNKTPNLVCLFFAYTFSLRTESYENCIFWKSISQLCCIGNGMLNKVRYFYNSPIETICKICDTLHWYHVIRI